MSPIKLCKTLLLSNKAVYFFFILQKMPNLKVTKAKVRNHCPLCEGEVVDNQWPEHMMRCTQGKFPCKTCGKLFKKKEYLIRHEKKFHEKESVNQNDNGVDSGDEG